MKRRHLPAAFNNITSGHLVVLAIMLVVIIVAVTGTWGYVVTRSGPLEAPTTVRVPAGANLGNISQLLDDKGVIANPLWFRLSARALGADKQLQAGEYKFEAGVNLRDVISRLSRGDVIMHQLTIPEGWTSAEAAERIRTHDSLTGELKTIPAEGTLLPETYTFANGLARAELVSRMQAAMEATLADAWEARQPDLPYKTPQELLTMASIIEKETAVAAERGMVASVFTNRLKKGMKLQADPTIIYGLEDYDGDIRTRDIRNPHPYNTYVHRGLPPGPIANPGAASLLAAANPEQSDYLFFVADGKGGHVFAKTNLEHEKNVREYLKTLRNRE